MKSVFIVSLHRWCEYEYNECEICCVFSCKESAEKYAISNPRNVNLTEYARQGNEYIIEEYRVLE